MAAHSALEPSPVRTWSVYLPPNPSLDFCLSNFNLVPTDFFHVDSPDSATKPVAILARLGRGPAYVDHHIFMSTNETSHVYHCSFEAHDHDTQMLGHQRLAGRGKYKPVSGAYPPATDL
ncbi:hypothetical protein ACJZ2D_014376 [Fusarium nematophilum]